MLRPLIERLGWTIPRFGRLSSWAAPGPYMVRMNARQLLYGCETPILALCLWLPIPVSAADLLWSSCRSVPAFLFSRSRELDPVPVFVVESRQLE